MHDFILNNIGIILGIIVLAQALILSSQSRMFVWMLEVVKGIQQFMIASQALHEEAHKDLEKLKGK
jgi:hypothetical protein